MSYFILLIIHQKDTLFYAHLMILKLFLNTVFTLSSLYVMFGLTNLSMENLFHYEYISKFGKESK